MQKGVFKQILIVILACIAIMLAMALVFYQYIPSNKVMPSKVTAYAMPDSIKAEIEEDAGQDLTEQVETYEITDSDLDMYRSAKSYNPGKSDPFSSYTESENSIESSNATAPPSAGSSTTNTVDRNTTDNYYTAANVSRATK
ncbi:MAG: hypothetical protein IKG56_00975 [Clostridia bacterium]|nr:hypothetical protein [Clostridia bacterium]